MPPEVLGETGAWREESNENAGEGQPHFLISWPQSIPSSSNEICYLLSCVTNSHNSNQKAPGLHSKP